MIGVKGTPINDALDVARPKELVWYLAVRLEESREEPHKRDSAKRR